MTTAVRLPTVKFSPRIPRSQEEKVPSMTLSRSSLFVAAGALAAALATGVGPASAAADDSANCVGEFASTLNQFGQSFGVQGLGGRLVSEAARREGGVARYASINNCD